MANKNFKIQAGGSLSSLMGLFFYFEAVQNPLPNANGIIRKRLRNSLKVSYNVFGQLLALLH